MAKAASPIRLQSDLMESATIAADRMHRSATQQIEYWASIGRDVAGMVDPDSLLAISTGVARLKVEPVRAPAVAPDDLFAALESRRERGELSDAVTHSTVRYQASTTHPGLLERIGADGRQIGRFNNGVFIPVERTD